MTNILKHNKDQIKIAIENAFKTKPRKAGGLYVLGSESNIVSFITKLHELASLDCNREVKFTYATIYGDDNKPCGIAYHG